jgi:hypothetical protein
VSRRKAAPALDPAVELVVTVCRERIQAAAQEAATAEVARLLDEGHLLPLVQGAAASAMMAAFYETVVLLIPAQKQRSVVTTCIAALIEKLGEHHESIGFAVATAPAGATLQ